ncbi:MAG TPA: hypothetical protein VGF94_01140 [Kofleriaceae bacterium]|jgi:hypothetical protein
MTETITKVLVAALLATAVCFRLMHLSSIPGINGDEGWWGVQAQAWLHGQPYEARTTSGNAIDMAFLVPLGLVQLLGKPSFFLLRALPAFSNLLGLLIGFLLVRRIWGRATASIQTVALAIAPTAISHSRFCQDPSQSIIWTSITIYLCLLGLKERPRWWLYFVASLAAFAVALVTHPTNVFVAPFLVLPLCPVVRRWIPASRRGRVYFAAASIAAAAVLALFAAFVAWPALKASTGSSTLLDKPWLATARARLFDGGQWFEYVRNYGRLFSGVTIYRYFSGPHLVTPIYGIAAGLVAIGVAAGIIRALRTGRSSLDYGLVSGWATMWLLFFLFAGPESIRPHVERWGLCLMAPMTLVAARALTTWIGTGPRARRIAIACGGVVAVALLGSFYLNYFHEFETTGGRSHRTFVTAETEPKQLALERVLAERSTDEPVMIVAQDWWQYWPIAYLALGYTGVATRRDLTGEDDPEFRGALAHGELYFVEFERSPELARARDWIATRHLHASETAIQNAGGRDLFAVIKVSPGP